MTQAASQVTKIVATPRGGGSIFPESAKEVGVRPDVSLRERTACPGREGLRNSGCEVRMALSPELELSVGGQNLLQPHHAAFGGDPGGPVGIRGASTRSWCGALEEIKCL